MSESRPEDKKEVVEAEELRAFVTEHPAGRQVMKLIEDEIGLAYDAVSDMRVKDPVTIARLMGGVHFGRDLLLKIFGKIHRGRDVIRREKEIQERKKKETRRDFESVPMPVFQRDAL
jgi:hypothetical protein